MTILEKSTARAVSPNVPTSRAALWDQVVIHFAGVSGRSPDEVRREISQLGGDVLITDKEAKAIFARLEYEYDREGMFNPGDLCPSKATENPAALIPRAGCADPAEDTSVEGMIDIIAGKLGL